MKKGQLQKLIKSLHKASKYYNDAIKMLELENNEIKSVPKKKAKKKK